MLGSFDRVRQRRDYRVLALLNVWAIALVRDVPVTFPIAL